MNRLTFSWDPKKAQDNAKRHRVSFQEAVSVFLDENATEFFDEDHSGNEDRFLMLGVSFRLRLLVVSYAVHDKARQIRLISARKATKNESKAYTRAKS